jgi:cell fate (sporulation/competence/biofilm development) regulator YmcA (YheA/YmcA/DUF963 family)
VIRVDQEQEKLGKETLKEKNSQRVIDASPMIEETEPKVEDCNHMVSYASTTIKAKYSRG